jgi:hypothetical protein
LKSEGNIKLDEDAFNVNVNNVNKEDAEPVKTPQVIKSTKNKKITDPNSLSTTPKSGIKVMSSLPHDKKISQTNMSNLNTLKGDNKQILKKSSESKASDKSPFISSPSHKINWTTNPKLQVVLQNFTSHLLLQYRETTLLQCFSKLFKFSNSDLIIKLNQIKQQMNNLLTTNEEELQENYPFIIRCIESSLTSVNLKLLSKNCNKKNLSIHRKTESLFTQDHCLTEGDCFLDRKFLDRERDRSDNNFTNLNFSAMSDDVHLINDYNFKNKSVSFEIPINNFNFSTKRERAMSESNEEEISKFESRSVLREKLDSRLSCKNRLSSEEVLQRMRNKLETAEKNKNIKFQNYQENVDKLMSRIKDIKTRKKSEKLEKQQKLYDKLEKFNQRHQQYIQEKVSKAKNEQDKVAEINFLHRMEKENKDLSLIKKLDLSIERRQKYMMQKLSKTIQRNIKEEQVEKKRKSLEDDLRNKILTKFDRKLNSSKLDQSNMISISNKEKFEEVMKRKNSLEEKIDFLKNVYSENFIWELLQADYFDVDDLFNLTNITKFEIVKAKLRKDKEMIDRMWENNKIKKSSNKTTTGTLYSGTTDQLGPQFTEFQDDNLNFDSDSCNSTKSLKKAKSFTIFNDNDFLEIDYLFKPDNNKKKRKKKKKKPENQIRHRLIRTINTMSSKDISSFYTKINTDKKMKKILIKSHKSGKYLKSRIIIRNEDLKSNEIMKAVGEVKNSGSKVESMNAINQPSQIQSHTLQTPTSTNPFKSPRKESTSLQNNLHLTPQNKDHDESRGLINLKALDSQKEEIIKNIIQCTDLEKDEPNTIMLKSESVSKLLENNSIMVKWCKLCNVIIPNDQDSSLHVSKPEHKKLKTEYGMSLTDDSTLIMVFQSLPGDISEDLKNERVNSIKLRLKKVKQKLSLRAIKHENFWTYKQDFPSINKQRIQKISFDIEKQVFPNIKDYDQLETNLKEMIKILEQKKQNDLHIMRQLKIINCLVEVLKKPAVCHKSEIKNLGKIIELVVKILMYFSSSLENRNYMVVTNRMTVIADLLLWVLNKPTKIPLGISFLPDLIYLITIHIKHRIPFEHLSMKDDFLEYLFLSNILVKFKQKYTSLVGPIDLTSGFGAFPLVLLKSLGMIEAMTNQINIK